jgi:hypothetical protein
MKRIARLGVVAWLLAATVAGAHVSPTVQLVRKGDFIRAAMPAAAGFFERGLDPASDTLRRLAARIGWRPSGEEIKLYVGRDEKQRLVGSAVFLRLPSEHGPLGLGVAFDSSGTLVQAVVTEVGSEPLAWVRPLIDAGALESLRGRAAASEIDPQTLAPQVDGRMCRYYAGIIAAGVERAGVVVEAEGLTAGREGGG